MVRRRTVLLSITTLLMTLITGCLEGDRTISDGTDETPTDSPDPLHHDFDLQLSIGYDGGETVDVTITAPETDEVVFEESYEYESGDRIEDDVGFEEAGEYVVEVETDVDEERGTWPVHNPDDHPTWQVWIDEDGTISMEEIY